MRCRCTCLTVVCFGSVSQLCSLRRCSVAATNKHAAAFERAQIVRLDARQIAMLRYYLGTNYEDIYVPLKGETDPHLGNVM